MNAQDLKTSILQLAIQGKLVEQRAEEGTATELLGQIKAEKERFIKAKKIKKEQPLQTIAEDEIPFDIPVSWEWVRIGEILNLQAGKNMSASDINENQSEEYKYPCYGGNGLRGYVKIFNRDGKYALIGRQGALCGNINYAKEKFYATEHAVVVDHFDKTDVMWCGYFLRALNLNQYATATAQPGLAVGNIVKVLIPLPPLEEQKRIVAKIEELMPYVEKYGDAHSKLEVFNKKFPEDVQKSILQYAIQGKLVEQRDEEGTAEALYQQIQEEKVKLIKEGKIKKEKPLPAITEDEIPFDIPDSWKWVRIPEMSYFQEGPGILAIDFRDSGVPLIRISGMQNDDLSLEGCNYLDPDMVEKRWSHYKLDPGDIVISTSASMDKICEVTDKTVGSIPYTGQIRFKMYVNVNKDYFRFFIKSSCYIKQINEQKSGGTIKHYGPTHLKKMIIPLPPLEEQKRIVAKIEELMPFCKQLVE
ncbi:restriction endonuclease subunit S [Paenibacillus sp. FSL R5-0912]|uniref:restriction endonuclease subunit S n=1 Tax=Paenibacillus sp. FSL R5-0912 TaxID=1536771 RepID=UPI00069451F6|nr:restriction endonuclease subunit S [Paenibacillus sp. FSL R5-0912]